MGTSKTKKAKKKRPASRIIDKDSIAVKTMLKFQPFSKALNEGFYLNNDGKELPQHVFYGQKSLKAWLKYQQSYEIKEEQIEKCYEEFDKCEDISAIHLPFPAVFITLISKNSTEVQNNNISFLICQNKDGYHTTAFLGDGMCYFYFDQEIMSQVIINHNSTKRDGLIAHYAFFAMLFISIYRKNPEINSVREIRIGGESLKTEISSNEKSTERCKIAEQLPDSNTPLFGAFDTSGLIPPCDRPEVFVPASGTHKSPREHWVREHTRVYWKRINGELVPVVKTIKTFKRGKSLAETSKLPETTRIYE